MAIRGYTQPDQGHDTGTVVVYNSESRDIKPTNGIAIIDHDLKTAATVINLSQSCSRIIIYDTNPVVKDIDPAAVNCEVVVVKEYRTYPQPEHPGFDMLKDFDKINF